MSALLETYGLTVTFGGVRAVDHLDLRIEAGKLVGVIGPNGAGKTTAIDGITGFVPASGRIVFDGKSIEALPAHRRARAGLGRTWQSLELFDDLTVAENLMVAAESPSWRDLLLDVVWPRRGRDHGAVERALCTVGIEDLRDRMPNEISQGQRKLVGVARALAASPKLVCMDEPAAGLDTDESVALGRRLREIVEAGVTILLVDHDMKLVLNVCDYIYVIEFGALIAAGTPTEVARDRHVIEAYLGASKTEGGP
jgi:branched-chain amino acid transport system ATP-binding protein